MSAADMSGDMTDGFHLVVEALKLNGVDTIFGVAGIPITDLLRLAQNEGIRYLGFRHEQSAGNAAAIAGYLTQKPGICMTVSAPGFLNGLVALANATTNCFPMIMISGSSDRAIVDLEQGDYEEMDQLAAARPYAKAAYRINRPQDIGIGVARAIRAAVSGRPGGVYLDLTAEVLGSALDAETAKKSLVKVVDPAPPQPPAPQSVARALELLANAQRPLAILGKGAAYARADEEIRSFIETTGIPFLPMSMAKGLLPDDHPQSAAAARSFAIGQADVVMVAGARLNWLLSHGRAPLWSEGTRLIQVDIQATEIDSNRAIAAPVDRRHQIGVRGVQCGAEAGADQAPGGVDGRDGQAQAAECRAHGGTPQRRPEPDELFERLARGAQRASPPSPMSTSSTKAPTRSISAATSSTWTSPATGSTAAPGGSWASAWAMPSGAAAVTGKPVVAIEGDSAFGFSGMEIETICRYELPVTTIVFNNNGVYRGDAPGSAYSPTGLLRDARYEKIIEAFGGKGYHVTDTPGLTRAVSEALASGKPALINAVIDPTAGTESGHIQSLNPRSAVAQKK